GHDYEYDRDGLRRFSRNRRGRIGPDDNDIRRKSDQFRAARAYAFGVLAGETVIEPNVTAFNPTEFMQALPEGRQILLHLRVTIIGEWYQHANTPYPPRLLRACRQWPCDG